MYQNINHGALFIIRFHLHRFEVTFQIVGYLLVLIYIGFVCVLKSMKQWLLSKRYSLSMGNLPKDNHSLIWEFKVLKKTTHN